MPVLQPEEYNQYYFDGYLGPYEHVAGYTKYVKWNRINDDFIAHAESDGEYFADLAKYYKYQQFLDGKKLLDIGCAKGFIVEHLRDIGIEAYGLDVSQYAIDNAREDIKQYLTVADARTHLASYAKNQFNVIYSRWFLSCISDDDLPNLIDQMNRVGRLQVHQIWTDLQPDYYNCHPMDWWLAQPFKNGTVLIDKDNVQNPYQV